MRKIGARHLDNRRNLLPRSYFEDPYTFGTPAGKAWMPPGGDPVSQRIAEYHHRLVIALRASNVRTGEVCARFQFGRDVWADVMNGKRWAGETVHIAMLDALANHTQRR